MVSPLHTYKIHSQLTQGFNESFEDTQTISNTGESFGSVLQKLAKDTVGSLHRSENLATQSIHGNTDLIALSAAQNEADLALKTATASLKAFIAAINGVTQIQVG